MLEQKTPVSLTLSPDGTKAVIEVQESDFDESRIVSRLWIVDVVEGKPKQWTFSFEGESSPVWSPDGLHVAFLSSRSDQTATVEAEEELAGQEQIWVIPTTGGEAWRLTRCREGVRGFRWAHDGKSIYFVTPETRPQARQFAWDEGQKHKFDAVIENEDKLRRQLWEVTVDEPKPELVFTGDYGLTEFDVSPDGTKIVYNTNYSGEPNDFHRFDLYILDLDSEDEPLLLIERGGSKTCPKWSPTGDKIAFLGPLEPTLGFSQQCVWTVSADGTGLSNLFQDTTFDAESVAYDSYDGILSFMVEDKTAVRVCCNESSSLRIMTSDPRVNVTDFDRRGGITVVIAEDDRTLPEVCVVQDDGSLKPITQFSKDLLERVDLPTQELVSYASGDFDIEAIVVHPSGAETDPLPLIVLVHGGPKAAASFTLRGYYLAAVWAAEGYRVLIPNFRGSSGYGNAFAIANRRDLGGGDLNDILHGVDALIDRGLADTERLAIMGGSYGGYMVNMAIAKTRRFRAAISMFGMFSLVTSTTNSELSRWEEEYLGAHYWDDPEIYQQCSASTHLKEIKTPTLILHGMSDSNTFISNSKELYHALRHRGVPVSFVQYPREGHGNREPNHRLDEIRRCLAWCDLYIFGDGTSLPFCRIGDVADVGGYQIQLLKAEEFDNHNPSGDARLIEVAVAVASIDPVEQSWEVRLADYRLVSGEGVECRFRGIVMDSGAGKSLVEGEKLTVTIHPDRETGRINFAPQLVFEVPWEGGDLTLYEGELPPFRFSIDCKDKEALQEELEEDGAVDVANSELKLIIE